MARRKLSLLAVAASGVLLALLMAAAAIAASPAPPRPYQAGDQVWTSSAAVPAPGATFFATPPGVGMVTVTPVKPYQPGDKVWTTNASVPKPASPDASGCQRVPSSGYIGTNVYASTTDEYATNWQWSASSSGEPFYWYIKHTDGSNQDYGYSSGGAGSDTVAGNIYYWEVQNKGADAQAWNVCYS